MLRLRVCPEWLGLVLGWAALLAMGSSALGHDGPDHEHAPRPVDEAVIHRPSPLPDRIILTWAGDPAHSQAVTWRTDDSVEKAVAQIAPADHGPNFVANARTLPATTTPLDSDLSRAHHHSVRFELLAPETKYAYRVGDGVNWSEWIHFQTAGEQARPFSFIYFGDAQNDVKSHWSRIVRGAYSDAPRAAFILHAGDLINRAERDAEWGEWFAAAGWINAMVPSIPTPGNHEYATIEAAVSNAAGSTPAKPERVLSKHWRPQFTLPENGPAGLEETCYSIDYQGTRVISLNSNEQLEIQAEWLDRVLGDNPNRWTVVTFHHPVYSTARNRDNPKLRELWQPIFDRHRVDLVLQGHDHSYGRSGLLASENVSTGASHRDPGGTVYVVSVSGPKMYDLKRDAWMKRAGEDTQLYQIITIDGDSLHYEALTALGRRYDAFELRKREGQPNAMIELDPDLPERLRQDPPQDLAPTRRAALNSADLNDDRAAR